MKKFILSVIVGGIIGVATGLAFLYVTPKLPDIFAQAFFYSKTELVSVLNLASFSYTAPDEDQYHIETIDKTIPQDKKVIYADLRAMEIILFENGQQLETYPIKSIGREGTAWQTPLGIFDMSYKTKNHFSSIGSVWMPYSMHFFGNYFIHGWPYYANGMPVAEGYSGGCIRLDTPDAQKVFEFVDKDTQLILTNQHAPTDQAPVFEYKRTSRPTDIEGSYVVVDIDTGEVFASSMSREVEPIGSFAKLMNALISLETLNQYQDAVFDQNLVRVSDVLYPLLLQDDTEASDVLSQHKNKNQYIKDMNTRAQSLGMKDTLYVDAAGQNIQSVSTLDDVVRLFMYFEEYKPFLVTVLGMNEYQKNNISVLNQFRFENDSYKAGFVSSDQSSLLVRLIHDFKKGEESVTKNILIIVHGSFDAPRDTQELIEWMNSSVTLK